MSLPSNSSVEMHLDTRQATATLRRGWPRQRVLGTTSGALAPPPAVPAAVPSAPAKDADDDTRGIAGVLTGLTEYGALKGAALNVDLSSGLVHFDVASGDFSGNTDRQLQGVANACVLELLGDEAGDREVRWQLQSDERSLLICALPRSEILALQKVAQRLGLRLASIRPRFVTLWNTYGRRKPGDGVFAVDDNAELTIASIVAGAIAAIGVGATSGQPDAALAAERLPPRDDDEALDVRVDRLLARLGRDPEAPASFVLVSCGGSSQAVSPRWTRIDAQGAIP